MSSEVAKTARVGKSLIQSKSVSGTVGRNMVGTGLVLGAGHVLAIFVPFLTGAFFGSIFLIPILLLLGFFLAE